MVGNRLVKIIGDRQMESRRQIHAEIPFGHVYVRKVHDITLTVKMSGVFSIPWNEGWACGFAHPNPLSI
jgi:hypothetical protein